MFNPNKPVSDRELARREKEYFDSIDPVGDTTFYDVEVTKISAIANVKKELKEILNRLNTQYYDNHDYMVNKIKITQVTDGFQLGETQYADPVFYGVIEYQYSVLKRDVVKGGGCCGEMAQKRCGENCHCKDV